MKKIILITVICSLCAMLTACSNVTESSGCSSAEESSNMFADIKCIRGGGGLADRVVFNDLDSLENEVDVIVVGEFIADSEQDVSSDYDEGFEKNIVTWVTSYNTIEVKKVLKGDVSVGDNLKIGQYYAVVDGDLITFSNLTPMQKGDKWLFFLKGYEEGDYWCFGDSDARYPVPNTENAPMPFTDDHNLGVYDEQDFNRGIYNEILEKYDI